MKPSISTVPWPPPFPGGIGGLLVPSITRVRSAWESRMLSNSARNRGGAGVAGSGSGPSSTSKSSRPFRRGTCGASGEGGRKARARRSGRTRLRNPWRTRARRLGGSAARSPPVPASAAVSRSSQIVVRDPGRLSAKSPDPARRHLDGGHERGHGVGQRERLVRRPALRKPPAELDARERLGEQRPTGG